MKKAFFVLIVFLLIFALAGCGGKTENQPEGSETSAGGSAENVQDGDEAPPIEDSGKMNYSLETGESAELPEGYPFDKFPIYEGSYIINVFELDGGYTVTAYAKDAPEKVKAFYEQVLSGAKVTSETKTKDSLTSFGSKDGYTYQLDVGESKEMEGYNTSIAIMLQPQN